MLCFKRLRSVVTPICARVNKQIFKSRLRNAYIGIEDFVHFPQDIRVHMLRYPLLLFLDVFLDDWRRNGLRSFRSSLRRDRRHSIWIVLQVAITDGLGCRHLDDRQASDARRGVRECGESKQRFRAVDLWRELRIWQQDERCLGKAGLRGRNRLDKPPGAAPSTSA